MPFVHRITARFFEVDRAGIAFFGRVFEYCHAAYEELLLAAGCGIERLIAEEGFGMPLVHCEADFKRPIRLHDRIDVSVEVERSSERSITFAYRLVGEDGQLRATAKLVHALVSLERFEPAPPPAALLDGLRRLGVLSG